MYNYRNSIKDQYINYIVNNRNWKHKQQATLISCEDSRHLLVNYYAQRLFIINKY